MGKVLIVATHNRELHKIGRVELPTASCCRLVRAPETFTKRFVANKMESLATLESGFLKPSMKPTKIVPVTFILILLAAAFTGDRSTFAQEGTRLKDVRIGGNVRVEEDGIRLHVKSRPGDAFNAALIEQDVKAIYRMGFFDDVQAELSSDNVLTYAVKEKPLSATCASSAAGWQKTKLKRWGCPRTILDRTGVEGVSRKLPTEQGYVNAAVDYVMKKQITGGGCARHRRGADVDQTDFV
jgi:hypothetical protein